MEPVPRPRACGGLEGKNVHLKPVDPFKSMVEACERIGIDVEPSFHPTVPGLVVLRPVPKNAPPEASRAGEAPSKPEPAVAGPDHEARLALISRIDRLLGFEKRVAELESENHILQDLVARLASENRDLRKGSGQAEPARKGQEAAPL